MAQPVGQGQSCDETAGPPPTLQQNLALVGRPGDTEVYRAAAIVTIASIGTPVWNTLDGHRWTQAEVNVGTPVQPGVYTPYIVTVDRPLGGGLQADQRVTAYVPGGETKFGDAFYSCLGQPTIPNPQPGWEAVVIFGKEVDTGSAVGLLKRPTVSEFDVIKSGAVHTERGSEPIP